MRKRDGLKSPVRKNCTPGSVRGPSGNRRSYRDDDVDGLEYVVALSAVLDSVRKLLKLRTPLAYPGNQSDRPGSIFLACSHFVYVSLRKLTCPPPIGVLPSHCFLRRILPPFHAGV